MSFLENEGTRCHLGIREQASLDTEPAWASIWTFSASGTIRNRFLLLINDPVCGIYVTAARTN